MWKYSEIKLPEDTFSTHCSVIPAHPWVYGLGQKTDNGIYLSPNNAVRYLAEQLEKSGGISDVVIFLVTGNGHDDFMQSLGELVDVLPVPSMMQVIRLAESAAALVTEKMQIPAPLATFPSGAPFSTASTRAAMNARLISDAHNAAAAGFSQDAVKEAMSDFAQARESALKSITDEAKVLLGKTTTAWVFSGQDGAAINAAKMLKGIPLDSYVHCAAVMFTGDDLSGIRGMIHEYEPNTGT